MRLHSATRTRNIALTGLLSGLQALSTLVFISKFIGGAGFITLEIVIVPVVALLLEPWQSFLSAAIGSTLGFFLDAALGIGLAPVFGPLSILLAPSAAYFGSVAFHYDKNWFKWSSSAWLALPLGFLSFGALFYIAFSQGTWLWLGPYLIAILSLLYRPITHKRNVRILICCLTTAMCWQVGLNLIAISILGLVGPVWLIITPFMYFERTVATLGSFVIAQGLLRIEHPVIQRMVA